MKRKALFIGMLVLVQTACGGTLTTSKPASPAKASLTNSLSPMVSAAPCMTPEPEFLKTIQTRSVTEADSGKTLVEHVAGRFSVYLDDQLYPLADLESSANVSGLLGYVSNGSILGPQCYPIMFETLKQGQAIIKVKDFQLTVIIDDTLPLSTFPLH